MKVQLIRKTEVARDVLSFEFADPAGAALPAFSAGAHIDVTPADGLVRQYSLCNDPRETHRYVLGVLREPASRGGSTAMHALREGVLLEISAPRNHFPLAPEAAHYILLAGGIGVTPILCMAERLAHAGASFETHYCTREPERAAFRERFEAAHLKPHSRLYFDTAPASERFDLARVLAAPAADTHVYVCGPAGFIDFVLDTARGLGWRSENVHREYFGAPTANAAAHDSDGPFQVKLASSGRVVEVGATQTIVAALEAAGIALATSCEQGVCGTCLTRVLAGEPDHRDVYLTDEERAANDQLLPCCSRSKSPVLVLDL